MPGLLASFFDFTLCLPFMPARIPSSSRDGQFSSLLPSSPAMRNANSELGGVWKALSRELSGPLLRELLHSQRSWIRHGRRKAAQQYMCRGYSAATAYAMATDERIDTIRSFFAKQMRQYSSPARENGTGHSSILGLPITLGMAKEKVVNLLGAVPSTSHNDALMATTMLFGKPTEITLRLDCFNFSSESGEALRRFASIMGISHRIVSHPSGGFTFAERPAWLSCVEAEFCDTEVENKIFEHFCHKYKRVAKHDNLMFDTHSGGHANTGAFVADDRYLYCSSSHTAGGTRMTVRYIDRGIYESKSRCRDLCTMAGNGDISILLYENGSFCGFPWGTHAGDIAKAFPGKPITVGCDFLTVRLLSYPHAIDMHFRFDEEMRLIWGDFSFSISNRGIEKHINSFFSRKYTALSADAMPKELIQELFGRKSSSLRCYAFEDDRVLVAHMNGAWHIIRGHSEGMRGMLQRRRAESDGRRRFIESELEKF